MRKIFIILSALCRKFHLSQFFFAFSNERSIKLPMHGMVRLRRNRANHLLQAIGCIIIAFSLLGCHGQSWRVGKKVRASDADVAAALGDTNQESSAGLEATDIPEIAYPRALRSCCAFGGDLKVAVGKVPVPGVEIGNLLDPGDVGSHRYDNWYLSIQRSDPRGIVDNEHNGLIYTCRGGFIDLAHVRDNADNTLALAAAIGRSLEKGGTIEVPPQCAAMRVRLRPITAEAIRKYGRMQLAVALAEWLAYQLSIWHEIATFYGYASLSQWPEKISAFSPEYHRISPRSSTGRSSRLTARIPLPSSTFSREPLRVP